MAVHFVKSEEIRSLAERVFEKQRKKIYRINANASVYHVGGTAIPGALTRGDLDIQVNVEPDDFEDTVSGLKRLYEINHPELWTDQFALFHKKDHPQIPISVILCESRSRFDEKRKECEILKNNPDLLEKYNNLKRQFEGESEEDYKQAKREMFGENGQSIFLEKYQNHQSTR